MELLTLGDQVLHLMTGLLSGVLFIVSYRSYRTMKSDKFLYVSVAFGFFLIKEILLLYQAFQGSWWAIDFSAHILNLIILTSFFRGVTK